MVGMYALPTKQSAFINRPTMISDTDSVRCTAQINETISPQNKRAKLSVFFTLSTQVHKRTMYTTDDKAAIIG